MDYSWYCIDICKDEYLDFREFLNDHRIEFEVSKNGSEYHFEVFVTEDDCALVNRYISEMRCKHRTIKFEKCTPEEANDKGYPVFNQCNHYVADMSHLRINEEDWMNTLSIKLPNGNFVTMCIMQTCDNETCIDVKFHGENLENHRVIGFGGESKDISIDNKGLYALVAYSKK